MKKLFAFLFLASSILVSCQQKAKVSPVDLNAEKTAVTAVMDKMVTALNARDAKAEMALLTEDATVLGTDPTEFWTKAQMAEMARQMFADSTLKFNFKPEKREVILSHDGNSAIVVEQMIIDFISPKIQVRRICHLVKSDGNWMVNFDSSSMIPKNEDLPVINKAMAGE